MHELHECFQLLATSPMMGRPCDVLVQGLRRFEHGKHVVFYVLLADGVLIARVLHQQMIPEKQQFGGVPAAGGA
jgi:toxin ParE1/3/4